MNLRDLIRMLVMQFFICYTCTMAATICFCKLDQPAVDVLEVDYLWKAGIFSVMAVLPGAVYYGKDGLSRRQLRVRNVVHTVLLEIVLLAAGWYIGMYRGIIGFVAFAVTVLIVDGLVRLFTYLADRTTTDAINSQLAERRKGRKE